MNDDADRLDEAAQILRPGLDRRYQDPLDLIWIHAAARLGMRVVRSEEVYAAWDGRAELTLTASGGFDPDDSLAQLIFHEICHALTEGPERVHVVDWGLENTDRRDLVREHACHRVQAALADPFGLRELLAVTTVYRPYYDALPPEPLAPGADPAIPIARAGHRRGVSGPWAAPIAEALRATAQLAAIVAPFAPPESLWRLARPPHPTALGPGDDPTRLCGGCAWAQPSDEGLRCVVAAGAIVQADWMGCKHHEAPLDAAACGRCGACCREAFHQVSVEDGAALYTESPELIAHDEYGAHLPRPGGRCVLLRGDGQAAPYLCARYAARPSACAEFEPGGESCREARRRLGLRG